MCLRVSPQELSRVLDRWRSRQASRDSNESMNEIVSSCLVPVSQSWYHSSCSSCSSSYSFANIHSWWFCTCLVVSWPRVLGTRFFTHHFYYLSVICSCVLLYYFTTVKWRFLASYYFLYGRCCDGYFWFYLYRYCFDDWTGLWNAFEFTMPLMKLSRIFSFATCHGDNLFWGGFFFFFLATIQDVLLLGSRKLICWNEEGQWNVLRWRINDRAFCIYNFKFDVFVLGFWKFYFQNFKELWFMSSGHKR